MLVDFLEQYGLSKRILKDLSYESQLGKSLKNTLHKFNKNEVLQEIDNIHPVSYTHLPYLCISRKTCVSRLIR